MEGFIIAAVATYWCKLSVFLNLMNFYFLRSAYFLLGPMICMRLGTVGSSSYFFFQESFHCLDQSSI